MAPAEPLGQGQCVEVRRSLACLPARLQPETRRALTQVADEGGPSTAAGSRLRVRRPRVQKHTPRRVRVWLRVRRPAVRKRTPPPGSRSALDSQTGGAEAHAAAGFGFGFGFANRRCGSARHRRVRVRTDRLLGSATGPLGKALVRWGRP